MEVHNLGPNTGECEMAFANASLVPQANAGAAAARDPKNAATWGKVGHNEDCPLRLRQDVQALPRQICVSRRTSSKASRDVVTAPSIGHPGEKAGIPTVMRAAPSFWVQNGLRKHIKSIVISGT